MPLAFYGKRADAKFWDLHWEGILTEGIGSIMRNLEGSFLAQMMKKWLPKEGKILEGGCGLGQWVLYLKGKGYNIVGVDFAKATIKQVKNLFPDLPVIVGDILSLPFHNKAFSAYLSFGVIEHFEEGPAKALAEAYRVLEEGGLLFCTVPYFNPLRRVKKAIFKSYHQSKAGEEFYQWAFAKQEINNIMRNAGFKVVRIIPFDAVKGIKDEFSGARKVYELLRSHSHGIEGKTRVGENDVVNKPVWLPACKGVKLALKWTLNRYLVRNLFGHMLLIIAEKRQGEER